MRGLLVGAILTVTLTTEACSTSPATPPQPSVVPSDAASSVQGSTAAAPGADPPCRSVAVAAGDIVNDNTMADQTGRLAARQQPDLVLVLGDNQYPDGSLKRYRRH